MQLFSPKIDPYIGMKITVSWSQQCFFQKWRLILFLDYRYVSRPYYSFAELTWYWLLKYFIIIIIFITK